MKKYEELYSKLSKSGCGDYVMANFGGGRPSHLVLKSRTTKSQRRLLHIYCRRYYFGKPPSFIRMELTAGRHKEIVYCSVIGQPMLITIKEDGRVMILSRPSRIKQIREFACLDLE
jgi:hypothetical protein